MAVPAKSRRIEIRVTDEEHAVAEAAAQTLGVTLSEFYRQAARARRAPARASCVSKARRVEPLDAALHRIAASTAVTAFSRRPPTATRRWSR